MGNTSSKDKDSISDGGKEKLNTLDSYPSFSKSDTRESVRSLKGSIRSKISTTSSGKWDSPTASTAALPQGENQEQNEQTDSPSAGRLPTEGNASSVRNAQSARSPADGQGSRSMPSIDVTRPADDSGSDQPQLPPSPTLSASVGKGHSSINRAQQSGEVDHVSDAPPTGTLHPSSSQPPGVSILMKSTEPSPRSRSKLRNSFSLEGWGRERASVSRERNSFSIEGWSRDRSRSRERKSMSKERSTSSAIDSSMEISSLKASELDEMIQRLLDAGYAGKVTKTVCLKNAEIEAICKAVYELMLSQPTLLELSAPVKVVGDIHGQYTDLLRMFEMCGFPPESNYLFLGDYVDRGKQSLETILLLMCYKLKFPENFFLLRGNHESANVTRVYGFYDECKRRCNVKIWRTFIDAFNTLPIAAIVAGKIFCVHGGLSPRLGHMDDIRNIGRPTDVPDYGMLNDLLWSDPAEQDGEWETNERGVSYCFNKQVVVDFLQKHDFDLVCRAHMVVEDGYEFFADRILVTVFSAPNVGFMTLRIPIHSWLT